MRWWLLISSFYFFHNTMYDKTYTRDEKFAVLDSATRIVKKILEMVDKEPQALQNAVIIKIQDILGEMKEEITKIKFSDRYEINKDKWEKKIWDRDSVQLTNDRELPVGVAIDQTDKNPFKYYSQKNGN